MNTVSVVSSSQVRRFLSRNVIRLALGSSLALLGAGQAAAQYPGGGGTYSGGGYSSAKGAAIGAGAAAGVGVALLAVHYHGHMTGCVQPGDDGLRLLDERKNVSYALVPGDVLLKPGQRVELKGKKSKNGSGTEMFTAKKLLKDLGSCSASSTPTASSANSASSAHQ